MAVAMSQSVLMSAAPSFVKMPTKVDTAAMPAKLCVRSPDQQIVEMHGDVFILRPERLDVDV